jgi:hypothetical protein
MPGPPALVTIATRSPRGSGCDPSSAATSSCSATPSVRMTAAAFQQRAARGRGPEAIAASSPPDGWSNRDGAQSRADAIACAAVRAACPSGESRKPTAIVSTSVRS